MKRVLLCSLILLVTTLVAFAYETIIIKYPPGELWVKAYYKKVGLEAILQYVPKGQTHENWKRTIIVHSYNESGFPVSTFISNDLARMMRTNPTANYTYLRMTDYDSIAGRCTNDYKNIKGQCEFYRTSRAHGGIITLHYITRDKADVMANYKEWYEIIKKAKYYNSYYRDERTFDKSEYFEL